MNWVYWTPPEYWVYKTDISCIMVESGALTTKLQHHYRDLLQLDRTACERLKATRLFPALTLAEYSIRDAHPKLNYFDKIVSGWRRQDCTVLSALA
jgi:hypothetical protein